MLTKKRIIVFAVLMLVLVVGGTGCLRQLTDRMDTLADKLNTAYEEMAVMNDQMETTKKEVEALKQKLAVSNTDMAAMNQRIDTMNKKSAEMDKSLKHMSNLSKTLDAMQKKLANVGMLFERILGPKQGSTRPLRDQQRTAASEVYLDTPIFAVEE